jgi:hypothetical protein
MKLFLKTKRRAPVYWLVAALAIFGFGAMAQRMANTLAKGFSVPEYYDPPHEKQLKSLLQGEEAEPLSGNLSLILIRRLKLQAFAETGETQMVVRAPQCVFDTTQRAVSSTGHLEAVSGDGRFFLEGEGFLFQQTNLNLIISNRVHTVIRGTPKIAPKQ